MSETGAGPWRDREYHHSLTTSTWSTCYPTLNINMPHSGRGSSIVLSPHMVWKLTNHIETSEVDCWGLHWHRITCYYCDTVDICIDI